MKKLFTKISSSALVLILGLGMVFFADTAYADYAFNTRAEDCDTTSIINQTTTEGYAQPCWNGQSITVRPGDIFTVKVYFRNTGDAVANNVRVRMTNANGVTFSAGSSKTFLGEIIVGSSLAESGSVKATFPSKVKVELVKTEFQATTQSGVLQAIDITGDSSLYSNGRLVNTALQPDLSNWGTIKVAYRAVAVDETPTGSKPTVSTNNPTNVGTNSATFQGSYSSNGYATTTCFQYRKANNSSWTTVNETSRGANASGSYSYTLSGLSNSSTYYYRACASNTAGTIYGSEKSFTTGDETPPGSEPTVSTNNPTNVGTNSATFQGSYSSNGYATTTCFQYRKANNSSWTTVNETSRGANASGSYSYTLSGLSNSSTYYYRACASNTAGTIYGSEKSFTTGAEEINDTNNITVVTNNANPSNNGTAVLYGNYYNSNYYVNKMNFEYRRSGGSQITLPSAGSSGNTSRGFSYTLTGLSDGNYEFRACADNGSYRCGDWVSFSMNRGDTYVPPTNNSDSLPSIQTLSGFGIESTNVIIDGFYNMNGCSGVTYFKYGVSASALNSTTGRVNRVNSGNMTIALTGLQPGTTYYYQAVAENCKGTTTGSVVSITTKKQTVTNTIIHNVTTNNTNNTGKIVATDIGGSARYVRLMIDNHRDTIARGEELVYDVAWENISHTDIRDLVLEVTFPKALQIVAADRGQIDRDANAVYIKISELRVSEKDDITVRTRLTGSLKDGDPVTARAILAFENPENQQAQENAIAYDSDTFVTTNNSVLGASIFGLGGLGSLAGWLFLILLLILVILAIRYMTRKEEHHHYYSRNDAPVVPSNASVVHHDDTDDYTPYRPVSRD